LGGKLFGEVFCRPSTAPVAAIVVVVVVGLHFYSAISHNA